MAERHLKLGIVAGALSGDVREVARLARGVGVEGLLFDAYSAGMSFPDLSASGRREFRHLVSSQDRQLVGLRVDVGPKGLSPQADIDRVVSRMDQAMQAARDVMAPLVCVDLGPLPAAPGRPKAKRRVTPEEAGLIIIPTLAAAPAPEVAPIPPAIDPNFVASVDAAMLEMGRLADRYNCTVAFRSDLSPVSALSRAVKAAGCPWFGIDFDPVAVLTDEWSADEVFADLGELIRHVRARDAIKGSGQRTQPTVIGQGSVDWAQTLALLDDAGYHGWVTIDPTGVADRAGAVAAGVNWLMRAGS
jgi:sugar phosphate isomerase/epimerase